jgi:hypothetical protein
MKFVIHAPLKLTQLEFWLTCDGYGSAGFVLLIISVVIISKNEKRFPFSDFGDSRGFVAQLFVYCFKKRPVPRVGTEHLNMSSISDGKQLSSAQQTAVGPVCLVPQAASFGTQIGLSGSPGK